MPAYSPDQVAENAIAFSFRIGEGYRYLGAPRSQNPPVHTPDLCEPTGDAENDSWHRLHPVGQPDGYFVRMRWNKDKKWWIAPLEASGRRVAFTSEYLASFGWTYLEAE